MCGQKRYTSWRRRKLGLLNASLRGVPSRFGGPEGGNASRKVADFVGRADVSFEDAPGLGKKPGTFPASGVASLEPGSEPVLVRQPAEAVNALNNISTVEPMLRNVGNRRFEVDSPVRVFLLG